MKKLFYLLALPIGLVLLMSFTIKVVNVAVASTANVGGKVNAKDPQNSNIISRKIIKSATGGRESEEVMVKVNNKLKLHYFGSVPGIIKIYFYIAGKLYNEEEVNRFTKDFTKQLDGKWGSGSATQFELPGYSLKNFDKIVWFGSEPKL